MFSLNYLSNKIDRMSVISNRLIPYYSTHPTFESDATCSVSSLRQDNNEAMTHVASGSNAYLNLYVCLGTVALYASSFSSLASLGCGDALCPVIIAVSVLNCSPCSGLFRTFAIISAVGMYSTTTDLSLTFPWIQKWRMLMCLDFSCVALPTLISA